MHLPWQYDRSLLPSAGQLAELLKERQTIRFFKEDKIDRELLAEIIGYGTYAPTNNYNLRTVVVDDPDMMEGLDAIIMQYVSKIYNLFFRSRPVFGLIRLFTSSIQETDKVKIEDDLARGRTYDKLPAATVYVVGDRRIALSVESAQYALYNMILYAQAKGIGSRLKGTGPLLLDRSKAARRRLGLQKHEHILGTIDLGYPAVKFSNKVEGKTMGVQWNDRQSDG